MTQSQRVASERLEVGQVVGGRYRVVRALGQGGMGQVYEVHDERLNERVALKTLDASLSADPLAVARFQAEVKNARRVSHPNVCRTFEFGVHGASGAEVHFLTMELLDGEALDARLRRGRPSREELVEVMAQVASAIDAAHQAGVVHRDLKPSNVMLIGQWPGLRAVVTDFGIARHVGDISLTREGWVGTAAYVAPEQLEGKPVGPPADVFALGVMLFEGATGRLPFEGDGAFEVALQRLARAAPRARAVDPTLSFELDALISRCLSRDPSARVASAAEVARVLRGQSRVRPVRSWRVPLRGAIGVLLLAAVAAGWAWRAQVPAHVVLRCQVQHDFVGEDAWLGRAAQRLLERRLAQDRRYSLARDGEDANTVVSLRLSRDASGAAHVELTAARAAWGSNAYAAVATAPSLSAALDALVPSLAEVLAHRAAEPPWTPAELAESGKLGAATPASARLYRQFTECYLQAEHAESTRCGELAEALVALDPGWPRAWLTKLHASRWGKAEAAQALAATAASTDRLGRLLLRLGCDDLSARTGPVPLDWVDGSDPLAAYSAVMLGGELEFGDAPTLLVRAFHFAPHLKLGDLGWRDEARRTAGLRDWEALAPESLARLMSVGSERSLRDARFLHGESTSLAHASVQLALRELRFEDARGQVTVLQSSHDPAVLADSLWLASQVATYEGQLGLALSLSLRGQLAAQKLDGRDAEPLRFVLFEHARQLATAIGDERAVVAQRQAFTEFMHGRAWGWAPLALLEYEADPAKCPDVQRWLVSHAAEDTDGLLATLLERAAQARGCGSCEAVLKRGLNEDAEFFDVPLWQFARCARQAHELPLALKALDVISKPGELFPSLAMSPYHVVLGRFEKARVLEELGKKDEAREAWTEALKFWRNADRPLPELKEAAAALAK
jgi:tRNA A-37 threonylcarbamoyl transferase component Bud32